MTNPISLRIDTPCSMSSTLFSPGSAASEPATSSPTSAATRQPTALSYPATSALITSAPADSTLTTATPAGTSTPDSRYCGSCRKSVIDFTAMTDHEILAWFSNHTGPTCGRFQTNQLNRYLTGQPQQLTNPPQRQPWWHGVWHYLLASLLFSSEVTAQQKLPSPSYSHHDSSNRSRETSPIAQDLNPSLDIQDLTPPFHMEILAPQSAIATSGTPPSPLSGTPQTATNLPGIPQSSVNLPDTIHGQILDSDNHEPVPFATIKLVGTRYGVQADADGKFVLLTNNFAGSHVLAITSVGYQTRDVDLRKFPVKDRTPNLTISMSSLKTTLGDVVVIAGYVVTAKKPKRSILSDTATILRDTLSTLGIIDKALTVYPNPVERGGSITLGLRLDQPDTYTVELFTINGALVETVQVTGDQRAKDILMNIPATLTPGNYFVRLSHHGTSKVHTRQLVIL